MSGERRASVIFACACAVIVLICAATFAINAALPGARDVAAPDGGWFSCTLTAGDTDDEGLLVKRRSGQRV